VEKIWRAHWPGGLDEAAIELPTEPLAVTLKRQARRVPRKPALIFYGRELTFAEVDEASDRFAGWLDARGLHPGDRVAIFLENCPQFAIAYFGALKAGAVNVCLNPMHKATELLHEFEDSGARFLVTSDPGWAVVAPIRDRTGLEAVAVTAYRDFLPTTPALPVPPSFLEPPGPRAGAEDFSVIARRATPLVAPKPRAPGDTALLQYTSGTTGVPKGAEITHGNIVANCELQRLYIRFTEDDVPLGVLPWFHITGMECQLNMMAYVGAPWSRSADSSLPRVSTPSGGTAARSPPSSPRSTSPSSTGPGRPNTTSLRCGRASRAARRCRRRSRDAGRR